MDNATVIAQEAVWKDVSLILFSPNKWPYVVLINIKFNLPILLNQLIYFKCSPLEYLLRVLFF